MSDADDVVLLVEVLKSMTTLHCPTLPATAVKPIFRDNYPVSAMAEPIRLLELYRTGEMEHKCLTRDEFLSLLSESALPFR